MTTAARVQRSDSAHWYSRAGEACYEVIGKSTGRPRPTTIRDARESDLLPSTTTILKCLHKQALVDWIAEQSALAVLTTPRRDGEALDAFVRRVLHEERQQDQEAQAARDLGTRIHAAIEEGLNQRTYDESLNAFVTPALNAINGMGRVLETEKIVVGDRYAGKFDALTEGEAIVLWDTKTSKSLPKTDSWWEHQCQTASYAKALGNTGDKRIWTANLYVSTIEPGKVKVCIQEDWDRAWQAFKALVDYFYLANEL
jgi:hypothetical protein